MGCIQASAYTGDPSAILGTYSGVYALDQCNNFCGVCCIPQCEEDNICSYCQTDLYAAHTRGTITISGAGTVIYNDPMNTYDPWYDGTNHSDTYNFNGTWTPIDYSQWVSPDGKSYLDQYGYIFVLIGNYNWPVYVGMAPEPYLTAGCSWDFGSFVVWNPAIHGYGSYSDIVNSGPNPPNPPLPPMDFPQGMTVGNAPTGAIFENDPVNEEACEAAGGLFLGADIGLTVDTCRFQTYTEYHSWEIGDGPGQIPFNTACPSPTVEGYDYGPPTSIVNDNGICCGGICTPYWIPDITYCYRPNSCINYIPNTNGCNDTIGQSGCVQGGVYSPSGVGIGVWHSGTSCANFDCNPCTTDSDCQYCETVWGVTPEYSEWGVRTVSGAAIINYSSTDPNDPLNGPHDPNGTYYPWFLDAGNMWYGKDHTDETIVGNPIGTGIYFVLSPNAPFIGNNDIKIAKSPYDIFENMWTNGDGASYFCYGGSVSYSGHVASTGTSVVVGGETITLTPASITDPIVTISYPTINSSTNKTVCETNNGVFFPVGWNPTFWGGLSVCEIYERVASSSATCTQSEYIGGNYNITPASISGPFGGSCCGLCYPLEGIDSSGCYTNVCPPNQ